MGRTVVVGAGSAGCVVARRLLDAGDEVVLVEAGPPLPPHAAPPEIDGPDLFAAHALPGRLWDGLRARRTAVGEPEPYTVGRGVGGSAAVNAMIAHRGDDAQYRRWGWHDAEQHRERVLVPAATVGEAEHGPVDRALLHADAAAGPVPLTRRDGRRITTAESYLWPGCSATGQR